MECAKGRSVFQHRRDKGDRKEVSIQADFAFLNTTGEIVADELPGSVKILVLTEMMSRCIGYVVVGEDVEAARRQIVVWLQHFGLTSKAVSIDVHTDSERAVGEIIGNSTGRYTFSIRRAAPQQHRSVGAAERTVRELKESFSVLRADLNAQGLDVICSHENLVDVLTYLALCNNHFSISRGSDRSPLEMVSGRKLSKPVSTLFGAQVLAEIPDSIRQHSPLSTRNVECTFIHMGLERGPVVQGFIRVDGKAELMRFVAGNIRAISPLRWDLNSGQGVLTQFDNGTVGSRPQIVNDSGTAPADMSQLPPEELRKCSSHLRLPCLFSNLALPRVDSPSGLASQTWPCHTLGSHKGWFLRNRCLPQVDVLKGGFFHSSSCHVCLEQASVSLGAPRTPTSLIHHGSQNGIQKTSRNMAARKGPRLYKKQSGTQRGKKHVLTHYAHASASQICLQNLCGQQQNSPMADPTFGCKSGAQNGVQAKA